MNTPETGIYRWMVFKDGEDWVGVALEFNIVIVGEDPRIVEVELQEAVIGYLESAKKLEKGFRPEQVNTILNQEPQSEYEEIWDKVTQPVSSQREEGVLSPFSDEYNVYKAGIANLANV